MPESVQVLPEFVFVMPGGRFPVDICQLCGLVGEPVTWAVSDMLTPVVAGSGDTTGRGDICAIVVAPATVSNAPSPATVATDHFTISATPVVPTTRTSGRIIWTSGVFWKSNSRDPNFVRIRRTFRWM